MKHPQFLTDILNHPNISEADKETAKAEVERMMKDREYAKKADFEAFDGGRVNDSFIWRRTKAGRRFWRSIHIKLLT